MQDEKAGGKNMAGQQKCMSSHTESPTGGISLKHQNRRSDNTKPNTDTNTESNIGDVRRRVNIQRFSDKNFTGDNKNTENINLNSDNINISDSKNSENSESADFSATNSHGFHEPSFASFWIDVKFWCFFLLETIVRLLWRLICLAGSATKEYFKQSFMSSYLGRGLMKVRELIFNNSLQRQRLLDWLQEVLPPNLVPKNFTTDWSSGALLCALCESIVPGTCPRYELLNQLPPATNILLALNLVETCFEFRPRISPRELLEPPKTSERKWIQLLSQIRLSHSAQSLRIGQNRKLSLKASFQRQSFFNSAAQFFNECFIRGTGIVHGVRSRKCCFAIYHGDHFPGPDTSLILHIEIHGPNSSHGLKLIEIPPECDMKKFRFPVPDESGNSDINNNVSQASKTPSINRNVVINTDKDSLISDQNYQELLMKAIKESRDSNIPQMRSVPIFYTLHSGHVQIEYIPIYSGRHWLNIIWKGQYVLGSPFCVNIQSSYYVEHKGKEVDPKLEPGNRYPTILLPQFSDSGKCDLDKYATVVERKVVQKRIFHRGKSFDFEDYFGKSLNRWNQQSFEIDRRIIEANTKSDDSASDSMPQTPTIYPNSLGDPESSPNMFPSSSQNILADNESPADLEDVDLDIELLTDSSGSWRMEDSLREDTQSKSSTFSNVSSKSLKELMKTNRTKLKSDLDKLKNALKSMGPKKKDKDKEKDKQKEEKS